MDFRVLVLDDNHSFVDLLKMKLGKFPLYFDAVFRHEQASLQIQKYGSFFSDELIEEVKVAVTHLQEWTDDNNDVISYPKLNRKLMNLDNIYNPDGYFMMIIEDKVERLPKGVEFIRNVISMNPCFRSEDFILFVDHSRKLDLIKENTIPVFLKDIRNTDIYQFVDAKVQKTRKKIQTLEELLKNFLQLRQELQKQLDKKNKKTSKKKASSTHPKKRTNL